ncbi:MAG TPA: DUF6438 domain-containing protein [Pyrinomonadaceae bacterium]|jgi:hypothetical protein
MLLALSLSLAAAVPVIILERTACYGFCPVYKLTIYDDGKVLYEGKDFVKHKGKAQGQIKQSELEALVREFERIDYLNLAENYTDDPKNCPEQWTDNPSAITSLNWKGKNKTVRHYYGCRGSNVLEQLTALESKIDEVVNTDQWIK